MPSGAALGCSPQSVWKTEASRGWQEFLLSSAAEVVCFSQGQIFCPACDLEKLREKAGAETLRHRLRALEGGVDDLLNRVSFQSAGVDFGIPGEGTR